MGVPVEAGPRPRTRLKNHGLSLVGFMQDSFTGLCLAGHEGMEKKMETTIINGLYWYNGKENGSYYSILGLYWDNGLP